MTHPLCLSCEYHKRGVNSWHIRCYSPQVIKAGLAGILVNFERDDFPEEGRSHQDGTGKCGPNLLNRKAMEDAA